MSPIEAHLVAQLRQELARLGGTATEITVVTGEAEQWQYRVTASGRQFEFGFDHRRQLWCRETTPGRERTLVSNDERPVGTSALAWRTAVERIVRACGDANFRVTDPPVI